MTLSTGCRRRLSRPSTSDGGEWLILIGSALTALLALAVGFFLMKGVLAEDQGTPKMKEIAKAIQEGAHGLPEASVQDDRHHPRARSRSSCSSRRPR